MQEYSQILLTWLEDYNIDLESVSTDDMWFKLLEWIPYLFEHGGSFNGERESFTKSAESTTEWRWSSYTSSVPWAIDIKSLKEKPDYS